MTDLFLIEGTLEQYFSDSNLHGFALVPASLSKRSQINQLAVDRHRTFLFSKSADCKKHIEIWSEKTKETRTDSYIQGNPEAGNLFGNFHRDPEDPFSAFYPKPYIFYKKEELALGMGHAMEAIKPHFRDLGFSYIDDEGNTRGLTLFYRNDDPSKWMIALTANANRSLERAQAKLLTPFNPEPWLRPNGSCSLSNSSTVRQDFITAIRSEKVASFINKVIDKEGNIHPNAVIMKFFTQSASESFVENDGLMNKFNSDCLNNKALIKLSNHIEINPSVANVERCLDEGTELFKAIDSYKPVENTSINQRHLGLLLFIDQYGLWNEKDALLNDESFATDLYVLIKNATETREFLAFCCKDSLKMSCMKLLLKANETDKRKFIRELNKIPGKQIWENLLKHLTSEKNELSIESLAPFFKLQKIEAIANKFDIGELWPYQKTPPTIRDELSLAIDYLAKNNASEQDYKLVFSVFENLTPLIVIGNKTTAAFVALYWEMKPLTSKKAIELYTNLLKNPETASAIAGAAAINLKVEQLYDANNEIIQALNIITKAASEDKGAHKLAMQDDAIGQQFRALISSISIENTKVLIDFLSKEIDNRKLLGLPDVDNEYYKFHFEVFKTLADKIQPTNISRQLVKVGFALCQSVEPETIFDYLLNNPTLIETIESTMAHNLPVNQFFLHPKDLFNLEVIAALKKITDRPISAINYKDAYKLAMQDDHIGRDFRRMLASPKANRVALRLIEFFTEDIYARQLAGEAFASAKDYQKMFNFFANLPADVKIDGSKINKPMMRACLAFCEVIDPERAKDKNIFEILEKLVRDPAKIQEIEAEFQKSHDFERLQAIVPNDPALLKFIREGVNARRLTKDPDSLKSCSHLNTKVNLDGLDQLLVTVNQLRDLGLDEKIIGFMLDREDKNANDFYRIVRKLEHQSALIQQELPQNDPNYVIFPEQEKQYRRNLLEALYIAIKPDTKGAQTQKRKLEEFTVRVRAAEAQIVTPLLQADNDPILRKIAQFFVNMATIVLSVITGGTFGYAHYRHHQKTGDLLFYSSPKSVEDYKTLGYEILEDVRENMTTNDFKPKK